VAQAFRLLVRRLAAFLLDWLLILVYIAILIGIGLLIRQSPLAPGWGALFADANRAEATAFVLLVLPVIAYFALFESSARQATPGKHRLRLTVATLDGDRVGIGRAALRNLLKFIPWELAHASIWRIPGLFSGRFPTASLPLGVQAGLILVYVIGGVYAISLLVTPRRQTIYDLLTGTVVRPTASLPAGV
jgi:uncharacterized RDD family membrane protein YckC